MLSSILFAVAVTLAASAPVADSLTGKVRIAGTSFRRVVSLIVDGKAIKITGEASGSKAGSEALAEIRRLQSITIEIIGKNFGDRFEVATYRILDIGGGAKPLVGMLAQAGDGLVLRDGDGDGIPLNVPPRNKRRLLKKIGAKAWVHGKRLVTGELQVLQYGILRDPPKPVVAADPDAVPAPVPKSNPAQEK